MSNVVKMGNPNSQTVGRDYEYQTTSYNNKLIFLRGENTGPMFWCGFHGLRVNRVSGGLIRVMTSNIQKNSKSKAKREKNLDLNLNMLTSKNLQQRNKKYEKIGIWEEKEKENEEVRRKRIVIIC